MDTSKDYIDMCEEAAEIHELWKPEAGDFYLWQNNKTRSANVAVVNAKHLVLAKKADIKFWLPRQDQLQDMVNPYKYLFNFEWGDGCFNMRYQSPGKITSWIHGKTMEQLWLAFVMKEKYNKIWNSKEWITVESIKEKPEKRCVLIGGDMTICNAWMNRNNIKSRRNIICAFRKDQIMGLSDVEVIEIGRAWLNPLYRTPALEMLKNRK